VSTNYLVPPGLISFANILIKSSNHCHHSQFLDYLLVLLDPSHGLIEGLCILQPFLELSPRLFLVHKLWNTRQFWPVDGQSLVVMLLHLAMGNNQNKSSFIPQQAT